MVRPATEEEIEEKRRKKREYMREYNKTEKGKAYNRSHTKSWKKRNPTKVKSNRKNMTQSYREILIDFLVRRDGFICGICNQSLENSKIEINHIIPVALGGKDVMENINLAHPNCNSLHGLEVRRQIHGY